ncbi:MAG: aminodeoxychorismate synthase, component I, partial [Silicimonas sp.]|nr:aminodeoxychorismate synthase, component I [Silicimonas sp.]
AEDFHVLSLSPELFLQTSDGNASMRPMKGTAPRGRTLEEDRDLKAMLAADEKSRAENLMILDLMRNDLGRLAEIGSVTVSDMFRVETFRSLHQMTSGVSARLRPDVDLPGLIRSIFPCGSVTGAPKIRAMEIIRELETEPRGVYTGAVGMIAPNGDVDLNVAIRTIMLDGAGKGELGIGSGVVFDSDGPAEFAESLLKAEFMTGRDAPFELIETMRWDRDGGYSLLDEHMERLTESAAYFGFACDVGAVRRALDGIATTLTGPCHRVRMTLDEFGRIDVTSAAIEPPSPDARTRYVIAEAATDSTNRFLFHKTTRRQFYDRTRERLKQETGCDEAVFVNEKGELTEGSYTNLFVERDGRLLTPPLACGLLNGTLRRALLADPDCAIEEAVLRPADLESADRVYLGNSVRGLVQAVPVDSMRRAG